MTSTRTIRSAPKRKHGPLSHSHGITINQPGLPPLSHRSPSFVLPRRTYKLNPLNPAKLELRAPKDTRIMALLAAQHRAAPLCSDSARPVDSGRIETLIEHAFTVDALPSCMSPATLIRLSRTSHATRRAVSGYFARAWDINRHLSRYFDDSTAFRTLQARTGTLISGSNALQFLDRSFYPGSDLDLYPHPQYTLEVARWISDQGYTFHPNSRQVRSSDKRSYIFSSI